MHIAAMVDFIAKDGQTARLGIHIYIHVLSKSYDLGITLYQNSLV